MRMVNSNGGANCSGSQTLGIRGFQKHYQWAEADKEFLRLVSENKESKCLSSNLACPMTHESFARRQRYLRSYTFSTRATVAQKTKKWLKKKQNMMIKSKGKSDSFVESVFKFLTVCGSS